MQPKALIVHQTRDRARLRISEKRDDREYFEKVQDRLGSASVIASVEINSKTGSILLRHPEQEWAAVEAQLIELELFEIVEQITQKPALTSVMSGITKFEKSILDVSSGTVDLRTLAFILLLGFALRQIMRGEILGPGLPLVWGALNLARQDIDNREADNGS